MRPDRDITVQLRNRSICANDIVFQDYENTDTDAIYTCTNADQQSYRVFFLEIEKSQHVNENSHKNSWTDYLKSHELYEYNWLVLSLI